VPAAPPHRGIALKDATLFSPRTYLSTPVVCHKRGGYNWRMGRGLQETSAAPVFLSGHPSHVEFWA